MWDYPPDGKGIVVCKEHLVRQEKRLVRADAGNAATELWHSVRKCHVPVSFATGADTLQVQAVYGVSSQRTARCG